MKPMTVVPARYHLTWREDLHTPGELVRLDRFNRVTPDILAFCDERGASSRAPTRARWRQGEHKVGHQLSPRPDVKAWGRIDRIAPP